MKKLLNSFGLILFVLLTVMCSCSSDEDENIDNNPGGSDKKDVDLTEDYWTHSVYKGDFYDVGTGYYWINIVSSNMVWDQQNQTYKGDGFILCVDFNSALADNVDKPKPAAGKYNIIDSDEYGEMTVNIADDDSYVNFYDEEGNCTEKYIRTGSFDI